GIAPTEISAVIPARPRKCGYATLGWRPDVSRRCASTHENYGWTAFASAVDVERSTTNVNRTPNLLEHATITPLADVLVQGGADQHDRDQHSDQSSASANQAICGFPGVARHEVAFPTTGREGK